LIGQDSVTRKIGIGIADSNPLMLGALSEFIEQDRRFSLIATSRTAESFLEIILRSNMQVGVIDWNLPLIGGERLLDILRTQPSAPRIVVYSNDTQADTARRAMAAGAAGFCARDESPARLSEVLIEVANGRMVFPFVDVRKLKTDPMESLTKRERALIEKLAQGYSNRDLANDLDISVNTVKFHLRNLFEKLSVGSRTQAIAIYYSSVSGQPILRPPQADSETD
jgi:two-component system nitrate/nitrite response regulator NarP